jgi:hypothetical protein
MLHLNVTKDNIILSPKAEFSTFVSINEAWWSFMTYIITVLYEIYYVFLIKDVNTNKTREINLKKYVTFRLKWIAFHNILRV